MKYPQVKSITSVGPSAIMVDKNGISYMLVKASDGRMAWTPIPMAVPSNIVELGGQN